MLSRGYNENSFRDDLKLLYNKLGMENKKMVFLFTDQHVVEEGITNNFTAFLTFGKILEIIVYMIKLFTFDVDKI